jgi:hypothetical protein
MPQAGQMGSPAGGGHSLRSLVDFESLAEVFYALGRVGPQFASTTFG